MFESSLNQQVQLSRPRIQQVSQQSDFDLDDGSHVEKATKGDRYEFAKFLINICLAVVAAIALSLLLICLCASYVLQTYSNADHGSNLNEVIVNLAEQPFEHLAYFSEDDQKFLEYTSYDSRNVFLQLPKLVVEIIYLRPYVKLHNHPAMHTTSFSAADLLDTCAHRQREIKSIIVCHDGVRTLQPGVSGWPEEAAALTFLQEHLDDIYAAERNGYVTIVSDTEYSVSYSNTDKLIQLYAETFGLIYTIEPLSNYS